MDHGPNEHQAEDPRIIVRQQRRGLLLFAIYATVYLLYILCCIGSPQTLEATYLFGIANSVTFGFGLISLAILIALVYGLICREPRSTVRSLEHHGGAKSDGGVR
ncbi:MAG: hypothetical protein JNL67_01430 [Planctomycetaceae bacterium]|nr:hypothetical protein [Planctomycetaceae bacterium]